MKLTRDDLLVLLIEECGEVIQAATKCLRFGFDVDHGTGYGNNRITLSKECGEVRSIIDAIDLDAATKMFAYSRKLERALTAKIQFGRAALSAETNRDGSEK